MTDERTATSGAKEENQKGQNEEVRMTAEEFEKRLMSETDKRVGQALKTNQQKLEQEYKQKIESERAEAEKLAKLSAEEREKELFQRSKAELDEKEKLLRNRELKLAAIDILTEENLPVSFADQLLGDSVEDTHDRIKKFKMAWRKAVDNEVKERLKGMTPNDGGKPTKKADMNEIMRTKFQRRGI